MRRGKYRNMAITMIMSMVMLFLASCGLIQPKAQTTDITPSSSRINANREYQGPVETSLTIESTPQGGQSGSKIEVQIPVQEEYRIRIEEK